MSDLVIIKTSENSYEFSPSELELFGYYHRALGRMGIATAHHRLAMFFTFIDHEISRRPGSLATESNNPIGYKWFEREGRFNDVDRYLFVEHPPNELDVKLGHDHPIRYRVFDSPEACMDALNWILNSSDSYPKARKVPNFRLRVAAFYRQWSGNKKHVALQLYDKWLDIFESGWTPPLPVQPTPHDSAKSRPARPSRPRSSRAGDSAALPPKQPRSEKAQDA